ncbi:alpha/beta-hydrolase family protein [Tropicimonas sp. IMCC34043]|uniref:alpha/beta hydrolase n=1 Tax=Tropicimonas sp. IMCC34043 TaxID=2248760 RepID=UPI001E60DC68|nr:alpha/beta-hydrolase family protein [Tropicimonas sp. IMCC34043]
MAALCFGATLTPSMLPRDPVIQGALGGAVAVIGYWVATYVWWLWRFLELPMPDARHSRSLRLVSVGVALLISMAFLWKAADWQNVTRAVMHLDAVETSQPYVIGGVAFAVFLVLLLLGRLVGFLMWRLDRLLGRVMPQRIGLFLGFLLSVFLVWTLVDGVLVQRILEGADASFEAADLLIEPETPQPTDPMKTGSAASLVKWDEMGRWGRRFVSAAPTLAEIEEFHPEGAMEPVRVYVGRRSADTPEERAELALKELIRTGGFDRSALVVMVPTGTGWMDAGSHDALDILLGGDVATVTVQYSYLTSFLALLVHPEYGIDQARALFNVIYDYWTTLPKDSRPKLYVHGLSQGAFNSEMTLPLLDLLADPIDGALWVGSPFLSPMWAQMRDGRQPDSPAWRPRWGNGSLARATNQQGFDPLVTGAWGPIRLVFLNYASDPIVVFTFDSGYRRPDWMRGQRAFDVSEQLPWIPGVTMFQIALDMVISLQVPGFGHFYIAPDYIDAWAAVMEPEGWSPGRSAELKAIFERRPAPW